MPIPGTLVGFGQFLMRVASFQVRDLSATEDRQAYTMTGRLLNLICPAFYTLCRNLRQPVVGSARESAARQERLLTMLVRIAHAQAMRQPIPDIGAVGDLTAGSDYPTHLYKVVVFTCELLRLAALPAPGTLRTGPQRAGFSVRFLAYTGNQYPHVPRVPVAGHSAVRIPEDFLTSDASARRAGAIVAAAAGGEVVADDNGDDEDAADNNNNDNNHDDSDDSNDDNGDTAMTEDQAETEQSLSL